jgi:hypothetical protein
MPSDDANGFAAELRVAFASILKRSRASYDGRWVYRRRDDGEPIPGFRWRSDAAAFLAVAGVLVQTWPSPRSSPRPGRRDRSAGPDGVRMSHRIEIHGLLRDQLQVHAEPQTERAMQSASLNLAGRLLLVSELTKALGLAPGIGLEGVA